MFLCLVEQILDQRLPRRGNTGKGIITVFQLWSYLESNGISDIEMHIAELAEEGMGTHLHTPAHTHMHAY